MNTQTHRTTATARGTPASRAWPTANGLSLRGTGA